MPSPTKANTAALALVHAELQGHGVANGRIRREDGLLQQRVGRDQLEAPVRQLSPCTRRYACLMRMLRASQKIQETVVTMAMANGTHNAVTASRE